MFSEAMCRFLNVLLKKSGNEPLMGTPFAGLDGTLHKQNVLDMQKTLVFYFTLFTTFFDEEAEKEGGGEGQSLFFTSKSP